MATLAHHRVCPRVSSRMQLLMYKFLGMYGHNATVMMGGCQTGLGESRAQLRVGGVTIDLACLSVVDV